MDNLSYDQINQYLVKIFNEIIDLEEKILSDGPFSDLTIKEMHTIEAIGMFGNKTSSQVATSLNITLGTLTIAIGNLVKKGYVLRKKDDRDKRIVFLELTKKGKLVYKIHERFHYLMVKETVNGFDENDQQLLIRALDNLHTFLMNKLSLLKDKN